MKKLFLFIIFAFISMNMAAQGDPRKVSGYVHDENGEPLMGVPVSIGEGKVSAVTDTEGFYSLTIPVEATVLKFSYVGLATEQITIAQGNTDLRRDLTMHSDHELGEVVVTGIFTRNKESFTGSVSTFKADAWREKPT